MDKKIKTRKQVAAISRRLRKQGKKIITLNGSFDILHPGHIKILKKAKAKGDILVVLLNSDKSIKSYKGPSRPINPQKKRAKVLADLSCVDYVALFDEINPKKILAEVKPNIHVNGSDWGKDCIERETVEKYGGKIEVVKLQKGFSTTNLLKDKKNLPAKAIFLDRDGTINLDKQGYLHKPEDMEFTPYAIQALQKLSKTDYKIIIITNQSGIGHKRFTEKDFQKLSSWFLTEFKKNKIRIDKIYHCPHRRDAGCNCRKPKIGMFEKAVKDFKISLANSWIVGDSLKDVVAGREANIKTIKIGGRLKPGSKIQPHFYTKNLLEAVNIILKAK